MLFNSYEYILLFLPIAVTGFFWIGGRVGREAALMWLVLASLFYYAWWNPGYLILLLFSISMNFIAGRCLITFAPISKFAQKLVLACGISANIGLIAYFKYSGFLVSNISYAFSLSLSVENIILPLAISFFTFQQIAYLVDVYRGLAREYSLGHYALFVVFFPQLIAGPIVHHAEMMPQFARQTVVGLCYGNIAVGLTIFTVGLFKKAVLADGVAAYATPVFDAAQAGSELTFFEAWGGALAYTMQLYFDFSGYSDMAIGSARMFGIRLPLNFFSPYKATNIVEFWRRWHMTLSRFLRDYLYIPLGGNQKGGTRRYANLMITMVLGGLWHGAGWTFVSWGALHGAYLIVNHAWQWLCRRAGRQTLRASRSWRALAWLLTFVAVVVGWVLFRAADLHAAMVMLRGMAGANGVSLPNGVVARLGEGTRALLGDLGVGTYLGGGTTFVYTWLWVGTLLLIVLLAPNTMQIMRGFEPTATKFMGNQDGAVQPLARLMVAFRWHPNAVWSVLVAGLGATAFLALTSVSEFLYFQF